MSGSQKVFVVSASSGAGKTTLNRRLIAEHDSIDISVSYASRPKREKEVDGVDYHFVSEEEFKRLVAAGDMLEWADVYGDLKGTGISEVKRIQSLGKKILLELDVQGTKSAKEKLPDVTAIFILPPSLKVLWERLEKRGSDSFESRWRRLLTAKEEIECAKLFDFFIVNDDLEDAFQELRSIVIDEKTGKISNKDGRIFCNKLIEEFETANWLKQLREKIQNSAQ